MKIMYQSNSIAEYPHLYCMYGLLKARRFGPGRSMEETINRMEEKDQELIVEELNRPGISEE